MTILSCSVVAFLEKRFLNLLILSCCRWIHLKFSFQLNVLTVKHYLEGLMLKLKLQYFDLVMQTGASLEKSLMLGKTEGRRRKRVSEDEKDGWPH